MLAGVISSRPAHYNLPARHRHIPSDATFPIKLLLPAPELTGLRRRVNYHSSTIELNFSVSDIWHAILPAGNNNGNNNILRPAGEGSWNVAWDVRPARWLHRPYTAWLLFGICACLAAPPVVEISGEPPVEIGGTGSEPVGAVDSKMNSNCITNNNNNVSESSINYRITGVSSDGRCLFRAIAHLVCLRNGEEAPNDNKQRELADELRAQVVSELVKRRKDIEWFIEDDFDLYIKMIEKPYIWGGEPELLMASHVLKTTISVFMLEETTKKLLHISTYGKEYEKDDESPIKLLFHGYGHYDILEDI